MRAQDKRGPTGDGFLGGEYSTKKRRDPDAREVVVKRKSSTVHYHRHSDSVLLCVQKIMYSIERMTANVLHCQCILLSLIFKLNFKFPCPDFKFRTAEVRMFYVSGPNKQLSKAFRGVSRRGT